MTFYTVSAAEPLADRLAEWLLAENAATPEQLAQVLIFLPTRRAIRTVREAFLRASGGRAMLLPQLLTMGDLDEEVILRHGKPSAAQLEKLAQLQPAPPGMERLMILQELVWEHGQKMIPRLHDREAAYDLAINLAELMDEMDREHGDWMMLDSLVPEDFAEHWQRTLEFLKIIREHWPQLQEGQGWMAPWQRRNQLFALLLECWQQHPPQVPVIAAGSTASTPAVAKLLKAIHALPQGSIVLPGFDTTLGETLASSTHPQLGMQELVLSAGVKPSQVKPLPVATVAPIDRQVFLSLAMASVGEAESWRVTQPEVAKALQGMACVETGNMQESSLAAALLMRETLEHSGKTAAFISPDRSMARAVSAQLARWGIQVDDSAGRPLAQTPQAVFLFLLLDAAAQGELRPVSLLSLVKHPLFVLAADKAEIYSAFRTLERKAMREVVSTDMHTVREQAKQECPQQVEWLDRVEQALAPLVAQFAGDKPLAFTEAVQVLLAVAEQCSTDRQGVLHLWQGEGAAELRDFFAKLNDLQVQSQINLSELAGLLRAMMRGEVVRPHYGTHPRLQILSPMEARLQRYDRVILADMNEGGWPEIPDSDPWMNREMRRKLGLPSADKRIGLQAHDFLQQASGGEVFLLRMSKSGGAEAVPSRFLQRMNAVMKMQGDLQWPQSEVMQWLHHLLHPAATPAAMRPAPKPPLTARPQKLSATRFERLMQDPYSIYAQKILRLNKLEKLERDPSHREFGNLVHKVLEDYFTQEGLDLLAHAEQVFTDESLGIVVNALWWPRMQRIARWILQQPAGERVHCEIKGEYRIKLKSGTEFVLTARVDRIDETATHFSVIDYKTGAPPSAEWMRVGMACQLTLAAIIAQETGFADAPSLTAKAVDALAYWKLGGDDGGEVKLFSKGKEQSYEEVLQIAREGLLKVLNAYDDVEMPYESVPDYRFKPSYNDYEHLARLKEWMD